MATVLAPSPNHSGNRWATVGVIIHGTNGPATTLELEYSGTLNWFSMPISEVSAHRVVAGNGNDAVCVVDDLIAWHAGAFYNSMYLGIEIVRPEAFGARGDDFTDAQYERVRELLVEWSETYGFPLNRSHVLGHYEINPYKHDPLPIDWDRLLVGDTMPRTVEQQTAIDVTRGIGNVLIGKAARMKQIGEYLQSIGHAAQGDEIVQFALDLNDANNFDKEWAEQLLDVAKFQETEWPA